MIESEIAISVEELIEMGRYIAPLYLKLHGGRLLCVVAGDDEANSLQIKKYASRAVKFLFVKPTHRDTLLDSGYTAGGLPFGPKMLFGASLQTTIRREWKRLPVMSGSSFANRFQECTVDMYGTVAFAIGTDEIFAQPFENLVSEDRELFSHTLETVQLSQFLLHALEVPYGVSYAEAALLALVHDVAKMTLPLDIRQKPLSRLFENDRTIFKSHTESLSLIAFRHPRMSQASKKIFQLYDSIERLGAQYPLEGNEAVWAVVIAHRLLDKNGSSQASYQNISELASLFSRFSFSDLEIQETVWRKILDRIYPVVQKVG